MVDYVKTTNFLAKDSLVSGDPNKRIRGAEFNVEFDNLATAITSKVEKNNGVHTGTTTFQNVTLSGTLSGTTASFSSVTMSGTLGVTGLATLASVDINGGNIDSTAIGATTPSTGAFTTLSSSGVATLDSLSTASATITGGSVNSTPIGNTAPSTGAFTTLSATGNVTLGDASDDAITVTGTATFDQATQFPDGTAALPSITNTGDTNTGVYFPAADTVAVSNGGTESLRIDSARNMGLGVTPQTWLNGSRVLQIGSRASIYQTSANSTTIANNYFQTTAGTLQYLVNGFALAYAQAAGIGSHVWQVAPSGMAGGTATLTNAMTLTNGGQLQLGAGTAALPSYTTSSDANTGFYFPAADIIGAATGGTERARITSGGYFKASNTGSYGGVAGVGDTSAGAFHQFQSDGNGLTCISVNGNTGSAVRGFSSYLATGATGQHFSGLVNGTNVYQVLANGDVRNTNNSYGAISDITYKENIVNAPSYLDRFMQVRFRNFNFIGSDLKQFGVVAQELETVFPSLVDETPDVEEVTRTRTVDVPAVDEVLDEEGNVITPAQPATTREESYTESVPTGTVTKSVKYSVLSLMAGKVIQELNVKVDEQQQIIEQQQAVLTDLLQRVAALEVK